MFYTVNSPTDKITAVKTAGISLLFLLVSVLMFVMNMPGAGIAILMLWGFLLCGIYFCIPKRILVTDTEIVLYNHGFKRIIKKSDVRKVRKATANDLAGLWRKFAAEGIFGYCGIYASKAHKTLYIYASQSKNWILIETGRKKYIISPESFDLLDRIGRTAP